MLNSRVWRLLSVCFAVGVAFSVLWAVSLPGDRPAGWLYAAFWFLCLLVVSAVDSVRQSERGRSPFVSVILMVGVVLLMIPLVAFSVPLRAGFGLSESEFDRLAERVELMDGGSVRVGRRVGSYHVTSVSSSNGHLLFGIRDAGGFDGSGGFLKAKPGSSAEVVEREIGVDVQELSGDWFSYVTSP